MPSAAQLISQAVAYVAFAASIGYLSASPTYLHADPERAIISLVVSHATKRVGECRKLTQAELAEIAKNMRTAEDCPRGRHDMHIEMLFDGEQLFSGAARPTGVWRDGPASIYGKFPAAKGEGMLTVRMRDTGREDGFDFERSSAIELRPRQNFVVDFTMLDGFQFDGDSQNR